MAEAPKVLIVLTSHATLGDTGKPTGFYLSELAHPYAVFTAQGLGVTLASPAGGAAPIDPSSVDAASAANDPISQSFYADHKSLWESTAPLESFLGHADEYAALFYPGGHGPMFDLAVDPVSQALIREFAAKGKVVGAVCHGPAVFVGVKGVDGEGSFLDGKRVTGFSNAEEEEVGLEKAVPFLLEDRLVELVGPAGGYEKAEGLWGEKVVVDGKLVTGQNPASAKGVGEAIAQLAWGA